MSNAAANAETHVPHPANEDGADACAQGPARDARMAQREAMLRRLAEIGMAMAEALAEEMAEVRAAAPDDQGLRPSVAPLSLAYNRVAGAVRQTLALETHVTAGENRRLAGIAAERAKAAAEIVRRKDHAETIMLVKAMDAHEILSQMIDAEHEDDEVWAKLHAEAYHHLVAAKEREDFDERAMGELVAEVAKAIGLCPDWDDWAGEDWAEADAEAKCWGSPYGRAFKPWRREDLEGAAGETGPP